MNIYRKIDQICAKCKIKELWTKLNLNNVNIGLILACLGVTFLILGLLHLFETGLLTLGNTLIYCGLGSVIGVKETRNFIFQRHKRTATAAFFVGILVKLLGYPLIGLFIEWYGFINMCRGFVPNAINFLKRNSSPFRFIYKFLELFQ